MDTPLMEAGIDSLSMIELRNALNEIFGLELQATFLFNHPTMAQIALHISRTLSERLKAEPSSANKISTHHTSQRNMVHFDILSHIANIVGRILGPLTFDQVRYNRF